MMRTLPILMLLGLMLAGCGAYPPQTGAVHAIRINQVGFLPDGPKVAVIASEREWSAFQVQTTDGTVVLEDSLSAPAFSASTDEHVQRADFSALTTPGRYRLFVPGLGASHAFDIRPDLYADVARVTAKALYFNRASTALAADHAGAWARTAGHPDTEVLVHPSAATEARPAGAQLSSPGGWYDAGDYNKYIVPAAYTSYFLLAPFEEELRASEALALNIPESGNAIPDLVDEAVWNLRWMFTMQDTDGGLYHKLTHANFSGMVMPDAATEPRYVVQKSTAAALTFAAAAAQAERVIAVYEADLPGLADSLGRAALDAWNWAKAHPDTYYRQDELNQQYDPDITTGAYANRDLADEWYWAGIELYLTTGDAGFYPDSRPDSAATPYWEKSVSLLGDWSAARLTTPGHLALPHHTYMQQLADAELAIQATSAYQIAVERDADFYWGATGTVAAKAGVFLQAYRQTGGTAYRDAAVHVVDYLLGRNGTTYSFVTGLGTRSPMFPHHRPSDADGVEAPVPGWLVGGPGALGIEDCEGYPSERRALRYLDATCSYSTNEVTTYWNAPLTHAALLLHASY